MRLRRVVVTGVGVVSPLGCGAELVWRRLLNGDSGVRRLPEATVKAMAALGLNSVTVAATVPRGVLEGEFDEESVFGRSVSREMSNFIQYSLLASDIALHHANMNFDATSVYNRENFGVCIASGGIGSLQDIVDTSRSFDKGFKKVSPYFVPKILTNMAAGHVSIKHRLQGPVHAAASACAAGLHGVGDAFNFIRYGHADGMLAGGAESSVDPLSIAGFARMKALTATADPLAASRPFDSHRNGFVIGEGSCVLVLEDLDHALRRGAPIIAEVVGYGLSGDAFHATSPSAEGKGAELAMKKALKDAGISTGDVGYINAHATSTPVGDVIEASVIDKVFARDRSDSDTPCPLFVSSTKGATGHLLGAAGALEAAFTVLGLRDGMLPPTLNLVEPAHTAANFQYVAKTSINYHEKSGKNLRYAMKNSFGFGGMNASMIFKKYDTLPNRRQRE